MWEEGPRAIFLDMENLHDTSFDVLILFFKHCLAQRSELAAAQSAVSSAVQHFCLLGQELHLALVSLLAASALPHGHEHLFSGVFLTTVLGNHNLCVPP